MISWLPWITDDSVLLEYYSVSVLKYIRDSRTKKMNSKSGALVKAIQEPLYKLDWSSIFGASILQFLRSDILDSCLGFVVRKFQNAKNESLVNSRCGLKKIRTKNSNSEWFYRSKQKMKIFTLKLVNAPRYNFKDQSHSRSAIPQKKSLILWDLWDAVISKPFRGVHWASENTPNKQV